MLDFQIRLLYIALTSENEGGKPPRLAAGQNYRDNNVNL